MLYSTPSAHELLRLGGQLDRQPHKRIEGLLAQPFLELLHGVAGAVGVRQKGVPGNRLSISAQLDDTVVQPRNGRLSRARFSVNHGADIELGPALIEMRMHPVFGEEGVRACELRLPHRGQRLQLAGGVAADGPHGGGKLDAASAAAPRDEHTHGVLVDVWVERELDRGNVPALEEGSRGRRRERDGGRFRTTERGRSDGA